MKRKAKRIVKAHEVEPNIVKGKEQEAAPSIDGEMKTRQDKAEDNIISCRYSAGTKLVVSEPWEPGKPVSFIYAPAGISTISAGFRAKETITCTIMVDPETAKDVQESFDYVCATEKQEPFGDEDHEAKKATLRFPPTTNFSYGEIKSHEGLIINGGEPTSYGAESVNGKVYRSWSGEFATDADYAKAHCKKGHWTFPDGVRGSESNPARIIAVHTVLGALTNKPAFKNMPPVKAKKAELEADTLKAAWSDAAREAALKVRREHINVEDLDEHSRRLQVRRVDAESLGLEALKEANEKGKTIIKVAHGGGVANKYGYPAETEGAVAVAYPTGEHWVGFARLPANKVTYGGVFEKVTGRRGLFDDRFSQEAQAKVRKEFLEDVKSKMKHPSSDEYLGQSENSPYNIEATDESPEGDTLKAGAPIGNKNAEGKRSFTIVAHPFTSPLTGEHKDHHLLLEGEELRAAGSLSHVTGWKERLEKETAKATDAIESDTVKAVSDDTANADLGVLNTAKLDGVKARYNVVKKGDKWHVVNKDGKDEGESDSEEKAKAHLKALYANSPDTKAMEAKDVDAEIVKAFETMVDEDLVKAKGTSEGVKKAWETRRHGGKIVEHGAYGFLTPPDHPEHKFTVETDLHLHPNNRASMSLSYAATSEHIDPATRKAAKEKLSEWEKNKHPLEHSETQDWIRQSHGYFKDMFRNPAAGEKQWHASEMLHNPGRDPVKEHEESAAVHHIREYYPEYKPKAEHVSGAYWCMKPVKSSNATKSLDTLYARNDENQRIVDGFTKRIPNIESREIVDQFCAKVSAKKATAQP